MTEPSPDPYVALLTRLLTAINEQNVQIENLRMLLVQRGVFSDAECQQQLIETRRLWALDYAEMLARARAEASAVAQQSLLRSHTGEPQ